MRRCVSASVIGAIALALLWRAQQIPSNDRNWSVDQVVLPEITTEGEVVTIKGVRDFRYDSLDSFQNSHVTRSYQLTRLRRVWFVLEHLSSWWDGPAHALLSFEFDGPEFLVVSAEIRKEVGEQFSPFWGLMRQYELMYVFADERDVIALRTNVRKHDVYVFPVLASEEAVRQLFLAILARAKGLSTTPEFYNTVANSCISNIVSHMRSLSKEGVPWTFAELLPGYADRAAYEMGLLDNQSSLQELRDRSFVTTKAQSAPVDETFSQRIRAQY